MAGVGLGSKPITYLDYNTAEDDLEKITSFLKDTQNFFSSLIVDYHDYSKLDDGNEKERLASFVQDANTDITRLLNVLKNRWERDQKKLAVRGLTGDALTTKLAAVKRARDEFLVTNYLIRYNHSIVHKSLSDVSTAEITYDDIPDGPYETEEGTYDRFKRAFRQEKKTSAQKWFERLEILLDSLLSELPGGNFLGEAKEYIKKILGF